MRPEQVIAAVRFDPLLPVWLLAVLGVVCLAVIALGLWRRGQGTLLRLGAFAVLLVWLAGPRLVQETRQSLRDIGLLVVDQSASMQVGDRTPLADMARQSIEAQAARFQDLELRTVTVPEAGNAGTQLFADVNRALADIPRSRLAGTITITDGQLHDVPPASPGGAPLNLLLTGRGEETDRRLRVIEAPGYGIVGKSVILRVAIDDLGTNGHTGPATLTVRRDGQPFRTESVPVGVEQRIEVPITRAGPTVIEMAASALSGEVSQLNNRAVVEINGVRDRLRVLLISGEPHQGERTWRRLLKADPSVDLVHFTILRPPEKDDRTPLNELALIAFPVRELFVDKIGEFDLIILDRFQNRGLLPLPYLANIANRVRQGGALLMSVGPEFSGADQPCVDAAWRHFAGRPGQDQRRGGRPVSPLGDGSRAAPSGDRGSAGRQSVRRWNQGAGLGTVVPADRARSGERRGVAAHAREPAAAGAGPGRTRSHRAAAVRPDLAVVARP